MLRISAGSTVQDQGRVGYREFGVPYGGAFDGESFFIGNALLGNDPGAPAVEMALLGGTFLCSQSSAFAIVGAKCQVTIDGRSERREKFMLQEGEQLEIGPVKSGVRSYLFVSGGFHSEVLLGSASGQPVCKGDILAYAGKPNGPAKLASPPGTLGRAALRYLPGPQSFNLDLFESVRFHVAMESDRKGLRLNGEFPAHLGEIPSEPAVFGAIQVTPSGMPIVVGPDGPTIGGYPKIGVVISADLSALGQLAPGVELSFRRVSLGEAAELSRAHEKRLEKLANEFRIANPSG